nr:hypothetical protein [Tanacetum cinerariifolium]
MALPHRDQRQQYLRFEGLHYTDADIMDFEMRLGKIYSREVHQVLVLDFESLPIEISKGLTGRMLMDRRDAQGQSVFTRHAWRRLFKVHGPLVFELIMEFFSTFRFKEAILDIDASDTLQFQLERQPDAATGALVDVRGAPDIDKGAHAQAVPAPAQAPQPPLATGPARTMAQRLVRVEEEVHEIQGALGEHREAMDAMARDLFRFTVWVARGISHLLDSVGATYVWTSLEKKSTKLVKYRSSGILYVL